MGLYSVFFDQVVVVSELGSILGMCFVNDGDVFGDT